MLSAAYFTFVYLISPPASTPPTPPPPTTKKTPTQTQTQTQKGLLLTFWELLCTLVSLICTCFGHFN